ncbi:MAG: type 4a pilus biogenesis protein PilO [Gracilibacteraceae bacterium]|jgi:Tfp pilus assembly protein PilO|nr:type 4a pilus biogenesis protein PilO [Gracilibacteraceae bacterium]
MGANLPKSTLIALLLLFLAIMAMIALSVLNYLSLSDLQVDITALEQSTEESRNRVQDLRIAAGRKAELQRELAVLKKRVPDDPATMNFAYVMKELGWKNQGEVRDLQFSDAVLDGALMRHSFTMRYDGKYYPFVNLLEDLERLERFVRVGKVTLKSGSSSATVEVEITADVFSQPPPPETPPEEEETAVQ